MNTNKKDSQDFPNQSKEAIAFGVSKAIAIFTTLLILVITLFPFNFTPTNLSVSKILSSFSAPSDFSDVFGNVLLFAPFGFGVGGWIEKRRLSIMAVIICTVLISTALSLTVEISQLFLLSRNTDYTDVITNSLGGFLGVIAHFLCNLARVAHRLSTIVKPIQPILSRRRLAAALIAWVVLTGLINLKIQQATDLSNWDTQYSLMLGNEATGDRPWQGKISQLAIADRAISESEVAEVLANQNTLASKSLIANYSFVGKDNYQDLTKQLPDLVWQGNPPQQQVSRGVNLAANHWLSTSTAATNLSTRLRQSSQFTLSTIVVTNSPRQEGPARIISFSSDPFHRNFTLGQEKTNLVFRLRTPITGENGMLAGLGVPNIFQDTQPHHLIFTYSHSVLRLYVDRVEQLYSLELTPEVTLFRYLLPFEGSDFHLTELGTFINKLMYYFLFFAPSGILTAFITTLFPGKLNFSVLLFIGGIVVPALLLELLIRGGNSFRLDNLTISIAIATITMLLVKNRLTIWLRSVSI